MLNDEIIHSLIICSSRIEKRSDAYSFESSNKRKKMQPADYRLVRSHIQAGIMMAIKQNVYPKIVDGHFSSWLYGQKKSSEQIPVNLSRSMLCLICSNDDYFKHEDFSLLNVIFTMFTFTYSSTIINTLFVT